MPALKIDFTFLLVLKNEALFTFLVTAELVNDDYCIFGVIKKSNHKEIFLNKVLVKVRTKDQSNSDIVSSKLSTTRH